MTANLLLCHRLNTKAAPRMFKMMLIKYIAVKVHSNRKSVTSIRPQSGVPLYTVL